jgi:Helix-turn-helix domain of resolvase.
MCKDCHLKLSPEYESRSQAIKAGILRRKLEKGFCGRKAKVDLELVAAMSRYKAEGNSYKKVAKYFNLSVGTVHRYLTRASYIPHE